MNILLFNIFIIKKKIIEFSSVLTDTLLVRLYLNILFLIKAKEG